MTACWRNKMQTRIHASCSSTSVPWDALSKPRDATVTAWFAELHVSQDSLALAGRPRRASDSVWEILKGYGRVSQESHVSE